ncbi:hypothetical protein [Arthrobacter sp. UYEF3]|uniref:hypothetical protein n=1 Tax=Arthrobacter sp. UYEF3 TaxID=1756365 RepID=UPI0033982C94
MSEFITKLDKSDNPFVHAGGDLKEPSSGHARPSKMFADTSKLVGSTAFLSSFNRGAFAQMDASELLATMRPALDVKEVEAFADSLREAADEQILAEVEALPGRLLCTAMALSRTLDGLNLMLPFGPDRYVRATVQLMSVLAVCTVLWIAGVAVDENVIFSKVLDVMQLPTAALA